jgi:hypothetical protein
MIDCIFAFTYFVYLHLLNAYSYHFPTKDISYELGIKEALSRGSGMTAATTGGALL